jgi:4-aminobutyrate aminotransferase-like enzyme
VSHWKTSPPELLTAVPGPRSKELASRLAKVESRNVTCLAPTAPIFWERASGANVWDVDGNRFSTWAEDSAWQMWGMATPE